MRNLQFSILPLLLATLLVASCRRDVSAAEGSPAASQSSGAVTVASAPSFDEVGFSLRMVLAEPYAVDKPGVLSVELRAKPPYHVNQEYPHKLKLKPSEAIEFSNQTFTRDTMTLDSMSIALKVPLKPKHAGVAKVEGDFAFSLCTADRCLIEKRTLATEIRVK